MGYVAKTIDPTLILSALTSDSIKWKGGDLDSAISTAGKLGASLRFYSTPTLATITGGANTRALGSVAIPNLSGLTIAVARAGLLVNATNDLGAVNAINTTQEIQVDTGSAGWINAILILDNHIQFTADGGGYFELWGNIDISSKVAFNQTTDFQWLASQADGANILANCVSVIEVIVQ